MAENLELYIHIPFCIRKCRYCDFLSGCSDAGEQAAYVKKLCEEIAGASGIVENYNVSSIFIGGGTPSILDPELINEILTTVRRFYDVSEDAEISIECNPSSTMRYKFAGYRDAGINRLSIGLQTADNDELKTLGRAHTFEEFLKSYQSARMEGFHNINIDLMNYIPTQTPDSWRKTLKSVLMMRPEHVSVYNLIVEPQTPFGKMQEEGRLSLPSETEMAQIDAITDEMMVTQKYGRYEVSNYAKDGYACRHNIGYWTGVPYLGFGLGASSYYKGMRFKNPSDMDTYLQRKGSFPDLKSFLSEREEVEELSVEEMMREFMILGLRMTDGVSDLDFYTRFGRHMEEIYGTIIAKYLRFKLFEQDGEKLRFSKRGMDVSNQILSDF